MKRIATVALMFSLLLAVPLFAADKPAAPKLRGEVFGVPLEGEHAGKAVLFVLDGEMFSEYLYTAATNEMRLLAGGRVVADALADGERALRFQGDACSRVPRGLENVVLIARDDTLEFPGGGRLPRIENVGAMVMHAPAGLDVFDEGSRLRVAGDASVTCCAACYATHATLTIATLWNFTWLDPICCLGGC